MRGHANDLPSAGPGLITMRLPGLGQKRGLAHLYDQVRSRFFSSINRERLASRGWLVTLRFQANRTIQGF